MGDVDLYLRNTLKKNKQKETHMKTTFKILTLLFSLGLISFAWAEDAPTTCSIRSYDGHYLTAVDGGGRTTDVLTTDKTKRDAWEIFTLINIARNEYGIKTNKGHYLSAQGGGGQISDVIHSDKTKWLNWEKFKLIPLGNEWYAIQTFTGNYLTAVGGGGRTTDVIHSDAKEIGKWEMWYFFCWTT
jgi:hypothetical protein